MLQSLGPSWEGCLASRSLSPVAASWARETPAEGVYSQAEAAGLVPSLVHRHERIDWVGEGEFARAGCHCLLKGLRWRKLRERRRSPDESGSWNWWQLLAVRC